MESQNPGKRRRTSTDDVNCKVVAEAIHKNYASYLSMQQKNYEATLRSLDESEEPDKQKKAFISEFVKTQTAVLKETNATLLTLLPKENSASVGSSASVALTVIKQEASSELHYSLDENLQNNLN